jgi:tetratricopeptide (TPR) repeat protein
MVVTFNRRDDAGLQTRLRQTRDLRSFIKDYRARTTPWPSNGRLDAIFVLHVGAAGLFSADADARAEAVGLLDHYREFVRSPFALRAAHGLASKSFECRWYGAAFAALEGALTPAPVLGMADAAIDRCPDDGGLRLARAIATDQQSSTRTTSLPGERQAPRATIDDVLARYADAFAFPAVADEARVRAAWAAYRHQNLDKAAELLAGVGSAPSDPVVNYLSHFVRGQVLRRQGNRDRAVAEYNAALAVVPAAQAPRVALMTLLTQLGRRAEAERLADAIETAPGNSFDPWWLYWLGDYRTFGARLSELRTLAEMP